MTTYYINADTGNDGNDGSAGSPWLLLSYAHSQSSSGDTIICQDSTATYTLASITWTKNLTIQGQQDNGSGAVFSGGSANVDFIVNASVSLTLEKLRFTNTSTYYLRFRAGGNDATITATNVWCYDSKSSGSGNEYSSGIFTGYQSFSGFTLTLNKCLFYGITTTDSVAGIIGGRLNANYTLTITGCIFYSNEASNVVDGFIYTLTGSGVFTIKNNIFEDPLAGSIDTYSGLTPPTVATNCCYHGSTDESWTASITSDPLLVDPDNQNFNLQPDSPCGWGTGVLT